MANVTVSNTKMGNSLQQIMDAEDLLPGDQPSYQACKAIYTLHPLGAKMAQAPIKLAQSQPRIINVSTGPEEMLLKAFVAEWKKLGANGVIANVETQSRVYGISSLALLVDGEDNGKPIDYTKVGSKRISFNVYDPLNTAGSLVLSQDTTSMDFQKPMDISVNGQRFHRSRTIIRMNENPIYIDFTTSAFGFVGRSVYQRALYPLKSFLQTMITDDMVARKAGLLVAKMKPSGSIVDRVMSGLFAAKRVLLQQAKVDQVLGISIDEDIQSINLQNLEGPAGQARTNILKNIATAADMPAVLLENETLTEGFGEGTEDAKNIARYVDGFRELMEPSYDFMDRVVMYRAWTPEFYKTVQQQFPEYKNKDYNTAFYEWCNGFTKEWPSILIEPESEQIKVEETKYKALVEILKVLIPVVDPTNKGLLIQWALDNLNENKKLFPNAMELDLDALTAYAEESLELEREAMAAAGDEDGADSRADSLTKLRDNMRRYKDPASVSRRKGVACG